jgi:hypothetical protein
LISGSFPSLPINKTLFKLPAIYKFHSDFY